MGQGLQPVTSGRLQERLRLLRGQVRPVLALDARSLHRLNDPVGRLLFNLLAWLRSSRRLLNKGLDRNRSKRDDWGRAGYFPP